MGQDGVSLGLPEMMHHEKDNHDMLRKLTGVALSLGPLDVEGEQLHLGSVETLEVRLDGGLAHQLVDGHDAEHGGLPHAALHVVIRLQDLNITTIYSIAQSLMLHRCPYLEEAGHNLAHV